VSRPSSPHRPEQLRTAIYDNQRQWVRRIGALDTCGAPCAVHEHGGVLAARTGTTGAIMLPAGTSPDHAALAHALGWLRASGSGNVLVWAAGPDPDADAWLLAHGAQEYFVPQWMSRSMDHPLPEAPAGPANVTRARAADLPALLNATELPYFSPWQASTVVRLATRDHPDTVALVVARVGGEIAGRGVLSLAQSPLGTTAGIYDVGIIPAWQRQGIGRQLVHAMLEVARNHEVDIVTLNSTPAGEHLYRSFGFEDAGKGQTWHLPTTVLVHPPDQDDVRFALRVTRGEPLGGLAHLASRLLPNRETPLALAARFDQVETARELLAMGTVPDIAALWELGLEEEALAAMRRHPPALNARHGAKQVAPLHLSIFWNDLALLRALLDHGADPAVRDGVFDGDAWAWCHALDNGEALELLNEMVGQTGNGTDPDR
jgi:[ribosomal protein S18]-alanine N-acetyltransferase